MAGDYVVVIGRDGFFQAPRRSLGWAVVRLTWVALLLAALVGEWVRSNGLAFGALGGLMGMALLEWRLIREGRSPWVGEEPPT